MRSRLLFPAILVLAGSPAYAQVLPTSGEERDLFALELVVYDLHEAKRLMRILDRDEDGYVDKNERERLPWKDEAKTFDLNHDGKLTHVELAIREAKLRDDNDITFTDINNVQKYLSRHDKNRNGQLDPQEIEEGGWPTNPDEYDQNGDGTITAKELQITFAFNRGLRAEMGIEGVDQTAAAGLIARFDKDKNRKLAPDEYRDALLPKPAKSFDEDEDGSLNLIELSTMYAKHRRDMGLTKPDARTIASVFSRFDMDRDGRITAKESTSSPFSGGELAVDAPEPKMHSQLEKYDLDKDGEVTIREVEKVVADVRKERGYVESDFQKAVTSLKRHDRNRSKYIEEHELFDEPKPGELAKSIFQSADKNSDKRIGLDELARYFAGKRKGK